MNPITFFFSLLLLASCKVDRPVERSATPLQKEFLSAVDISRYPEIAKTNPTFYDLNGNKKDFLEILKENGVNAARLKLWVNPLDGHAGLAEVKQFSTELKQKGFKIWLTLHYSDTWADPGRQETPRLWKNLPLSALKDSVSAYTSKVMQEIKPDYIQIGNEINSGLLHPTGHFSTNRNHLIELVQSGALAVRKNSNTCKIIIHYAGIQDAYGFFNALRSVDYDIIGLSYYPIWHGKSIAEVKTTLNTLSETLQKDIVLAETAYPFTLEWHDWTHNNVGQSDQLIPEIPASTEGQLKFMQEIRKISQETPRSIGFCYWGAELIAWKGEQSREASSWENQALFDFKNKAVPALRAFKND